MTKQERMKLKDHAQMLKRRLNALRKADKRHGIAPRRFGIAVGLSKDLMETLDILGRSR
jgi:hypothetical protein